jgi:peptide/nickel transport system substrate-binding protein/glutathione transport system substrate-binding protein
LKGAFSGAGALAIGAYAKGPSSPLSVKSFSRPTSKRSGTLVFALNSAPATIDPALANELASSATLYTIYDSLCQFDRSYKTLQPSLAVSWTSNADDTEWVFNLRPNVKFHDGTPFNSTAVRESILHFVAAGYGSLYGSIKTIDDSHPHVLKISLSQPSPDLALNQCFARVMSPKLLAEKGTLNNAVGTGAFQLVSWKPASQIVVAANPNYWGSPEPYLDGIKFSVVGNETARVDGLISGGLDVIEQVDPHDLSLLLGAPKVRLSGAPAWTEICLLNVCTQAPTNDVRVRQAVAYGIDRDALVRDVLLGQGTVATSPIPQGCYGHVTPSTGYEYSPSKARKLLKEAGYPKGLDIAMAGSSDLAIESLLGQAMAGQLSEAGFNVNFVMEDIGVLVSDVLSPHPKRQLYMIHYGWINGGPWHFDVGDIVQHAKYKGSALLNLIHKSSTTPDGRARMNYLTQAQNLWMQQLPHLPLYYPYNNDAFLHQVQGYEIPKDGYHPVLTSVSLA